MAGTRDQASVSATGVLSVSEVSTVDAPSVSAAGVLSVGTRDAPEVDRPFVDADGTLSGLSNLTLPQLTGTAEIGETLTVVDGTYNRPVTLTHQIWRADILSVGSDEIMVGEDTLFLTKENVDGETGPTYELVEDDEGYVFGVDETAESLVTQSDGVGPVESGLDPFSHAFVGATQDKTNLTIYTFTGHALGPAVSGANVRHTIIRTGTQSAAAGSSITVGGISATPAVAVPPTGGCPVEIWIVDTSSLGTTADIVVTLAVGSTGLGIAVSYMVNGDPTPHDTDTHTSHTSGASTVTLDIPTDGFAVAVAQCRETVLSTFSWSGTASPTDDDFDADTDTGDAMSGATSTAEGIGLTFVATNSDTTPTVQRLAAASWGPAA